MVLLTAALPGATLYFNLETLPEISIYFDSEIFKGLYDEVMAYDQPVDYLELHPTPKGYLLVGLVYHGSEWTLTGCWRPHKVKVATYPVDVVLE
jgi:hypothetical protein